MIIGVAILIGFIYLISTYGGDVAITEPQLDGLSSQEVSDVVDYLKQTGQTEAVHSIQQKVVSGLDFLPGTIQAPLPTEITPLTLTPEEIAAKVAAYNAPPVIKPVTVAPASKEPVSTFSDVYSPGTLTDKISKPKLLR